MSAPDPQQMREAMSRFATGVAIVTTTLRGRDHAMTAGSIASVSLDPPLVLVCIRLDGGLHDPLLESGIWGLSVLSAKGRATASWLATPGRPLLGQLERVPHHRGVSGVALIDDALVTLECRTTAAYPGGDHTIVVGEVIDWEPGERPEDPLIHYRSQYWSPR
ncbi:flavin reductase family protein [Janibacter sp. GXQ6167]|uniref:flavin reductase family protein n=1 Tax=Janibacter sp. GXQ6167 TaxID=3240791 RepID=UPI00352628C6